MNERIRELNLQALCEVMNGPDPDGDVFNKMYIPSEFTKKFAELIVRECVGICMKNQFDGAENYNNGSVSSAEFIKEHFGVQDESQRYTPYDPKLGKSITTTGQAVLRKLIKQLGLK